MLAAGMPAFDARRFKSAQKACRVRGPRRAVTNRSRALADADERRSSVLQVPFQPADRLLPERHQPFLAALAQDAHHTHVERDLRNRQADELGDAQARRVEGLQHRAIAQAEDSLRVRRGKQRLDFGFGEILRQAPRKFRRADAQRRIGAQCALQQLQRIETPKRREPARDRRRLRFRAELIGEKRLDIGALRAEQQNAAPVEPRGPRSEVAAIARQR